MVGAALAFSAAPAAQAYPSTVCSVSVTPRHLVGGKTITATGTANTDTDWTFTLVRSGTVLATAQGHGKTFTHVFATPRVTKQTSLVLRSSCGGDTPVLLDPVSGTGGVGGNGNGHGTNGGPANHGSGGVLPNTGGPALWLALLAAALLGGGATVLRRQRRQAAVRVSRH
jgi:LPXTG-motif cell wall-anchored protein